MPRATYRVCHVSGNSALIKREEDGAPHTAWWTRTRARRPGVCAATGQTLTPSDLVYLPAADVPYRTERIAASYIETPEGDPRP